MSSYIDNGNSSPTYPSKAIFSEDSAVMSSDLNKIYKSFSKLDINFTLYDIVKQLFPDR